MKIITDSASLYSVEEGENLGVTVIPACVLVDDISYRDYEDVDSDTFLKWVEEGKMPTSSQPAIGDVLQVFEETQEEILLLSIGDGLSGTYQNAVGARNCVENSERIHIVNTKSLAGVERYLVQKSLRLRELGTEVERIKEQLQKSIESSVSFVIPADFDFLKRSGRLTPIAAKIGGLIKIVPVLTQTADKTRIETFAIKRSVKKAVDSIIGHFHSMGVDENFRISIGHAGVYEKARQILEQIREHFAHTEMELLPLSPALITHGGPGCVTIQAVLK